MLLATRAIRTAPKTWRYGWTLQCAALRPLWTSTVCERLADSALEGGHPQQELTTVIVGISDAHTCSG